MKNILIVNFAGAYKSSIYGITDIIDYCSSHFGQKIAITVVDSLPEVCLGIDYVILPACTYDSIKRLASSEIGTKLIQLYDSGTILCSVCLSAFVFAELNLLNGRNATTHWKGADTLQARYPDIQVDKSQIIMKDGRLITTGGLTSYNDLALYIIREEYSCDIASYVAKIFLVNSQRDSQLPYIEHRLSSFKDPLIDKLQALITGDFQAVLTIEALSSQLCISSKQLNRRSVKETGLSVGAFIRSLKMTYAADLLESGATVAEAAESVGYMDVPAFCRRFKTEKGLSPGQWSIR